MDVTKESITKWAETKQRSERFALYLSLKKKNSNLNHGRWQMEFNKVLGLMEQTCRDCILEIECPVCGGIIVSEPDATDLYCEECKQIVMQNPLTEAGLI